MISFEQILLIPKEEIPEAAGALSGEDIPQLAELLSARDDKLRYQAFLLLQSRSEAFPDVYPYWERFRGKLTSENSYQRSIGLMLMAENVRWDTEGRMEDSLDELLALVNDEKPITVRQCIQSLGKVARWKPGLRGRIADRLMAIDLMAVKETMRRSVLLDIIGVLLAIRKELKTDEVESFLLSALSGEILDRKSKKQLEQALRQ